MYLKLIASLTTVALLQACSSTEVVPGTFNTDPAKYKNAYVGEVSISSPEGNDDELAQNKAFEKLTRTKIETALREKNFATIDQTKPTGSPALIFNFTSTINYGSRAGRWMMGGLTSVGKGTVSSKLEATDSTTKAPIYTASAESELKAGVAGGSMDSIIEENIDELLDGFVNSK